MTVRKPFSTVTPPARGRASFAPAASRPQKAGAAQDDQTREERGKITPLGGTRVTDRFDAVRRFQPPPEGHQGQGEQEAERNRRQQDSDQEDAQAKCPRSEERRVGKECRSRW